MGTKAATPYETTQRVFSSRGDGEINSPARLLFPASEKNHKAKSIDVHVQVTRIL